MANDQRPEPQLSYLHGAPLGKVSRKEALDADGIVRFDPETAHKAVGDEEYERRLPESCGICKATELSEAAGAQVSRYIQATKEE